MATEIPIKIQFVKSLSTTQPSRIVVVKADGDTAFSLWVTDKTGIPYPLKDLQNNVIITNTDGNLQITSSSTNTNINLESSILTTINSALQSGGNISELVNDVGYLVQSDIINYTNEDAQDAVGTILVDTTTIDFTYNDTTPSISADVKLNSIDATHLANNINVSKFTNDSGYITLADVDGTDLTYSSSLTDGTIISSTGSDAIIPLASIVNAGLISPQEKQNIASAIQLEDLANVATSGNYEDLNNIPTTFNPTPHTHPISDIVNLQTNLDLKQDNLVSGTSIKTLEGQSLLGSGNINLTKLDVGLANVPNTDFTSAVAANTAKTTNQTHTGDATGATVLTLATVNSNVGSFGTASNVPQYTVNAKGLTTASANIPIQIAESQVINLVADLSNKQATLVSGTNIRTINGNTLLGATDLTIPVATDATTLAKGIVQLAGDLGGTADNPTTPTAIHKIGDEIKHGILTLSDGLKIVGNTTSTTATKVNVQENDGTINTKPLSELAKYLEFASAVNLPVTGEQGKLYLTKDNNRLYRFNGTIYQELTTDISSKENIANKQNSLAVDGTGVKYPTVDATNAGLDLKSDKLNFINIKDLGGVGNGVFDNTAIISNALATYKEVYFPDGNYLVSSLVNNLGAKITGSGIIVKSITGGTQQLNTGIDRYNYVFGQEYLSAFQNIIIARGGNNGITAKVSWSGDSTTAGDGITDGAYLLSNLFKATANVNGIANITSLNRGHSGANTEQWRTTFLAGDLAENPDLYIIRWGINDPGWLKNGTTPPLDSGDTYPNRRDIEDFETSLRTALGTIRASKSQSEMSIILMSPNSTSDTPNGRDEKWYEQVRKVYIKAARDYKCAFIDTYSLWLDSRGAAGLYMDDPFSDGRAIHPLNIMNTWIVSKVFDLVFPESLKTLVSGGYLNNESSVDRLPLVSDLPEVYQKGLTLSRSYVPGGGVETGGNWPVDGTVSTFFNTDGTGYQFNASRLTNDPAIYFRTFKGGYLSEALSWSNTVKLWHSGNDAMFPKLANVNLFTNKMRVSGGGTSTSISNVNTTATHIIDVANTAISLATGYVGSDNVFLQSFNNSSNTPKPLILNPFGGTVNINNLSGTGTRNVVADASGNLLTDSTVYAPLASPLLTGIPTAPTPTAGSVGTQIATKEYVLANAGVTSTGTTNRIPKFTSSNSLGDSGLIQVGGNIGMGSAVVPGELFHIGDGNILLEGGGEVAQKFKRDFTTTGENLGVPTGSGISVNPIFQVGRIIQAGDGDPEIRIMYSDDNTSERTVFEVDRKGIAASVKTSIGSHFEGFASLTDVNPKFRLNSYPRMRLEMGAGGNDITDVAVERGATGSLDFFTNSAYRGGFDSSGNVDFTGAISAPTAAFSSGIQATQYNIYELNTAPTSATAIGTTGEIRITEGFIYICIATNTWVRAALTTWI